MVEWNANLKSNIFSPQDSTECIEPPNNPYGPYPCKAFTKVVAFKSKNEDSDEDEVKHSMSHLLENSNTNLNMV